MNFPRLTKVMLTASLFYLILGVSLGGALLIHKALSLPPLLWNFLPTHVNFLLWGWTTQLTLAVAYWIFPRFREGPERGNVTWNWMGVYAFNLSLGLSAVGSLFTSSWILFGARFLMVAGASILILFLWQRIRPYQGA